MNQFHVYRHFPLATYWLLTSNPSFYAIRAQHLMSFRLISFLCTSLYTAGVVASCKKWTNLRKIIWFLVLPISPLSICTAFCLKRKLSEFWGQSSPNSRLIAFFKLEAPSLTNPCGACYSYAILIELYCATRLMINMAAYSIQCCDDDSDRWWCFWWW